MTTALRFICPVLATSLLAVTPAHADERVTTDRPEAAATADATATPRATKKPAPGPEDGPSKQSPSKEVGENSEVDANAEVEANATTETARVETLKTHPLHWTIRYAKARSRYIREHIRDYSCRLIKRERIDGTLQKHQFIEIKVRCEQSGADSDPMPLAVFMHYLAPGTLKGRKVLYVDGQNDGLVQVLKGGRAFKYVKLEVDPNGTAARRESNHPITDVGFDKIIERLIHRVQDDIEHDPDAENTEVAHFRNAMVNDRVCTHIQVVHPEPRAGIDFHRASLYVDDKLNVPIRLTVHGWPETEGEEPVLMEEYTYVNLKLNVGLSDSDFSPSQLDRPRTRTASQ